MTKLADAQAISSDMEADFLRSFKQQSRAILSQLKRDSVCPGHVALVEEALADLRRVGITRIRVSALVALAAHNARVSQ